MKERSQILVTAMPLVDWENFYVIVGSSGAALVGLQFVVITLIGERRALASRETINAFGTPTVVHFAGALIVSAVMSAPWPSLVAASIALALCGIAGITYAVIVIRRARRQSDYAPTRADWLWYVLLPLALYGVLGGAAILLPGHAASALFAIGGVALGFLLLGIRNAWDSVTYVLTDEHASKPGR